MKNDSINFSDQKIQNKIKHYWLLLIFIWTTHNLEEAFTTSHWIENHKDILNFSFFPINNIQQSLPYALIIATVLIFLTGFFAIIKKWDNRILAITLGIFLVNAIQHITPAIILRQYTPGFYTALLINLPYAIITLKQLFKNKLLKNFTWVKVFVYGIIAFIISIILIWAIALALNFFLL